MQPTADRIARIVFAATLLAATFACNTETVVVQEAIRPDTVRRWIERPATETESRTRNFVRMSVSEPIRTLLNPPRLLQAVTASHREAFDVNANDDVDESGWFQHRNARQRMSLEEIARGPTRGPGPDSSRWTVVGAKVEGIMPGFTIRDGRGELYLVKFDPPDYPEMATATEVIASRLFYAAGYNTPELYIARIDTSRIRAADTLSITDRLGRERAMQTRDVHRILERVAVRDDGRVRAVASRVIPNTIGPSEFSGTRDDFPLDTVPHQHLRALRGLYVVAAWLNHVDLRETNTLDSFLGGDRPPYVRHHLIDFGSAMGSGGVRPNQPRDGVEYDLDLVNLAARLVSLGFYTAAWERYEYEIEHPSIGYYSSDPRLFDPGDWTSDFPLPPFLQRTTRDGYWGAKLVASFDSAQIRAAVDAGQLSDPAAADALVRTILERRDLTVAHWFLRVTPLEELEVTGPPRSPRLTFRDLAVKEGLVPTSGRRYRLRFRLEAADLEIEETRNLDLRDDGSGSLELPAPWMAGPELRSGVLDRPARERIGRLELRAEPRPGDPNPRSVRVYLLADRTSGYRIVGRAY